MLEGGWDGTSELRGTAPLVMGFFQLGKRPDGAFNGASVFRIFAFFGVGLKR
jgi:hypothetical protein